MDYEVKRPILWFYTGQGVYHSQLLKWYTEEAIEQLVETGYLKEIPVSKSKGCCSGSFPFSGCM